MKFKYQARSKDGDIRTGMVEASSREAALSLLQRNKIFVTLLENVDESSKPFYSKKITLFSGISQKDMVNFSRQLSLMFKSQIPLVESLNALSSQTKNSGLREKLSEITNDVEGGASFSQALSRFPKLFSSFYVSMVKSGEASGTLSESLDYLAEHLEREYHMSSKIRGAMIYPALILAVVIGVLVMMIFFVIPSLSQVLTESGQELPLMTRVVIGFSDFLRGWWWIFFFIFGGGGFLALRYFKTEEGKKNWDKIILKVPLIGSFLRMVYVSRFSENLSTLLDGGLPITSALQITGEVVGNSIYKDMITEIQEEVRRGQKMSRVMALYKEEFPPLVTQMVNVGERSGAIGKSLTNVVQFYQKEIDRAIENLLSILEPLLVVFLGGIVGLLMAAILMPMYKMTTI
jgi:type IV pilus assembly protein PilC